MWDRLLKELGYTSGIGHFYELVEQNYMTNDCDKTGQTCFWQHSVVRPWHLPGKLPSAAS